MKKGKDWNEKTDVYMDNLKYHGNVCISGLTASGKTTHSHMLAGELGLTYISGSQIQLNFLGVSPIQTRDFWIQSEAKGLWNEDQFKKIDTELLSLEQNRVGCIFDTSTMPWRHKKPALCIWLESSLESRVTKSIISHHGRTEFKRASYPEKIHEKDCATISLYNRLYSINIGKDLSCFDMILDITSLIEETSIEASIESISVAHKLIRPAVAWYLTNSTEFKEQFYLALDEYGEIVLLNRVQEALDELYKL